MIDTQLHIEERAVTQVQIQADTPEPALPCIRLQRLGFQVNWLVENDRGLDAPDTRTGAALPCRPAQCSRIIGERGPYVVWSKDRFGVGPMNDE